jgi:hypothetical protein
MHVDHLLFSQDPLRPALGLGGSELPVGGLILGGAGTRPGGAACRAFPDGAQPGMCCVETGSASSRAVRLQDPATRRFWSPQNGSRITLRWIFPTGLRGRAWSRKTTWLGFL